MRKMISGLFSGSKPVLVMTALVAVVGVSGTAVAGKHPGGKKDASTTASAVTQPESTSRGDLADSGEKSDRSNKWHKNKGHKWHKGKKDRDTEYGVATVNVLRGVGPATAWATYSTALGSPVGDTTGGVFRFTCSTANAPCTVSVGAAVLSDEHDTAGVYPRVLIYRQDYNSGGPEVYCEYGDGSTGSAPLALNKQASTSTPTYTPVPLNIGGSADCGLAGPAGDVAQIIVPAGYYDVHSSFVFLS